MAELLTGKTDEPEGYKIPIRKSLTGRIMLGGVPQRLAIANWTFCVALTLPLHTWYAIPISMFIHAAAYQFAKRDPDFLDVVRRSIRYKTFYRV